MTPAFRKELEELLNRHSMENGSNTPDFMLATYLNACLVAFDEIVKARDRWYGVRLRPGPVILGTNIPDAETPPF